MDHQFDESYPFVFIGHVWITIPSDRIITFNILVSCEHQLLPFPLFIKYLVHFFLGLLKL